MSALLAKNAMANIIQMIFTTALLLILYKGISKELGISTLGVWSVILASISVVRLSEFGLSASLVRFVALYAATGKTHLIPSLITTVVVTMFLGFGSLLPILYFALNAMLPSIFYGSDLITAQRLLPYALLSFWISIIGGVILSALDGMQKMVVRSRIFMMGQAIFTFFGLIFIKYFDVLGLAYAQLIQGIFLLSCGGIVLARVFGKFYISSYKFSFRILREIFGYGVTVQAGVIFMTILDPITKLMIVHDGGASVAGYFEIANQIVSRIRALITSANQAVIPHIASIDSHIPNVISNFYKENLRVLTFASLPLFSLIILWAHVFSWLIFDKEEEIFFKIFFVVTIGWMLNIFSSPAYFINQGLGEVRKNTVAIGLMVTLNVLLGFIFGYAYGPLGVVISYAISIGSGSIFLIVLFGLRYKINFKLRYLKGYIWQLIAFGFSCITTSLYLLEGFSSWYFYISFVLVNIFIIISSFSHPIFLKIFKKYKIYTI